MIEAWHFLEKRRTLRFPPYTPVEIGVTLTALKQPLKLCHYGLHASLRAIDALEYAPGSIVCRVVLAGEIRENDDKLCATHRTCLWMADATRALDAFGLWCIKRIMDRVPYANSVLRDALKTKENHMNGMASQEELDAAKGYVMSVSKSSDERTRRLAIATRYALGDDKCENIVYVHPVAYADVQSAGFKKGGWETAKAEQNEKLESLLMNLKPGA